MRSIYLYFEQNENLPRFPASPYKIPKNVMSVAYNFMKRKPNSYDTNAEDDRAESQQRIMSKHVKKSQAETGYPSGMGKLLA